MTDNRNRRVLLKLSGEAFADPEVGYGIDSITVNDRPLTGDVLPHAAGEHFTVDVRLRN